jgi:cytochrome b6-f complex iron-sulfur subunit
VPITRRVFLRNAATCGAAAVALCGGGLGCGNDVSPAPAFPNLIVDDDPASPLYGQIPVAAAVYQPLAPIGGAVTLNVQPLPNDGRQRPFTVPTEGILLIHRAGAGDSPEYVAFSSACPHLGCPLGYSASAERIECPCHGSRFIPICEDGNDTPGRAVHGPARGSLTSWPVTVGPNGVLYIDLNRRESCGRPFPDVINGQVILPLSDFPALATVGGSLVGTPKGLGDTLVVARVDEANVIALSAVCTHLRGPVAYSAANGDFECPWHGSRFDLKGAVTHGPAAAPLERYVASVDDTAVIVSVR